jgi:hypothetical protein
MSTIKNIVDELGALKAQIAILEARESEIAKILKARGAGVNEGPLFDANVIVADRNSVDWKAIALKLEPSRQLVTAHTSTSTVVTLKVTARLNRQVA